MEAVIYLGIIYKATGPDGRIYIGQTTKSLKERKCAHQKRAYFGDRRTAFHVALLEHGFKSFEWEQIDTAETAEELNEKERHWIAHYKANDPACGYNLQNGGTIGSKQSAITRQKISEASKGENCYWYGKQRSEETRKKLSEAGKGKTHTPETRLKMSLAHKGKKKPPLSEEHRRAISKAHKGSKHTMEHRQKIRQAQIGQKRKPHTPETKRKLSESLKKFYQSEQGIIGREKRSIRLKGKRPPGMGAVQ
jgi:hypothetical protein